MRSVWRYFRSLLPGFALEGEGLADAQTTAQLVDEELLLWSDALVARFPSRCVDDDVKLAFHGICRGLVRGSSETAAAFVPRLLAWRSAHAVRGGFPELCRQLSAMYGGSCVVQDQNGNQTRAEGGTLEVLHGIPWDWDGGAASNWARFWIWFAALGAWTHQLDYGDEDLWTSPTSLLGLAGCSLGDILTIRAMMHGGGLSRIWRPGGTQPEWLIVRVHASDVSGRSWDTSFDDSFGDSDTEYPDGTWGTWGKDVGGVRVPARSTAYCYVSLDPAHNNTYTGDADAFGLSVQMPDGETVYTGTEGSFGFPSVLMDGSAYTPDPTSFTTTLELPDDASVVYYVP